MLKGPKGGIAASQGLLSALVRSEAHTRTVTLTRIRVFPMTRSVECVALLKRAADLRKRSVMRVLPLIEGLALGPLNP